MQQKMQTNVNDRKQINGYLEIVGVVVEKTRGKGLEL